MKNNIVVALKGIIVKDGKILIVKRSPYDDFGANTWEFVGGKLDFGETLEEALQREIQEEVNLDVQVEKLLYATTFNTSKTRQLVILTYLCLSNQSIVVLSNEHQDYKWATINELKTLLPENINNDLTYNNIYEKIGAFDE